jgi:hypothetical protein
LFYFDFHYDVSPSSAAYADVEASSSWKSDFVGVGSGIDEFIDCRDEFGQFCEGINAYSLGILLG